MTTCVDGVIDLPVGDKILISWPVSGLGEEDTAEVSLDDAAFIPLAIGADEVQGTFCGPTYSPSTGCIVVTKACHVEVRITTTTQCTTQDGGFIRLVP